MRRQMPTDRHLSGAPQPPRTDRAAPSRMRSAIASAVAGAFKMPQTLWPVAT